MTDPATVRTLDLDALLETLGAPAPSPAGGTAAALAAAMAAALVGLVARAPSRWPDGPGVAAQASWLQERLVRLADTDAVAFAAALTEMRAVTAKGVERDRAIGEALARAADVPLEIAEAAADVAALAAFAALEGRDELRPDAEVARDLAAAAAQAAARLVDANLATRPGDERSARAAAAVRAAADG